MQRIVCLSLIGHVRLIRLPRPDAREITLDLCAVSAPKLVHGHCGHFADDIPQGVFYRGAFDEVRTKVLFEGERRLADEGLSDFLQIFRTHRSASGVSRDSGIGANSHHVEPVEHPGFDLFLRPGDDDPKVLYFGDYRCIFFGR